jgi:hypothetical protein
MKKILTLTSLVYVISSIITFQLTAQIYGPEGLNMSGNWNGWTNRPTNNLALASSTQVPGGRVSLNSVGNYQTKFSVASSGADLTAGSYNFC